MTYKCFNQGILSNLLSSQDKDQQKPNLVSLFRKLTLIEPLVN